ncbi:MAG TPA: gliding motility-associated C-terminal domain-containing protein [Bacteroidia bacterium]|jgi:gliding motility-associated-like protein
MRFFTTVIFVLFFLADHEGIHSQSVGGTTSGAATYCSFTNSGFISVSGFTGSTYFWESSTDGVNWNPTGTSWTGASGPPVIPPAIGQSYNNLSQTTCFRAIVQNGAFPPDTSTVSCITVFAPSAGGTISGGGNFCGSSGSGTLTLSGNTGNPLNWEFSTDNGSTWTPVANTSTTLNYSGITQNTVYHAIVQNGPACLVDTSSIIAFTIDPLSAAGILSGNDTVCPGLNSGLITLSGSTGNISGWIYSNNGGTNWNNLGVSTSTHTFSNLNEATFYQAIVQSGSCPPDSSNSVLIELFTLPAVNAGNDTTVVPGATLILNGNASGTTLWNPATGLSNSTVLDPVLQTGNNSTTYTLSVIDSNGCLNSDNVTITVQPPEFSGMISNLFTPNGDGINDTWYIQGIQNFRDTEVLIYNIYGNKVFEKKNYTNDWQGTYNGADLPDGTYYYVLRFGDDQQPLKGSVDIIRNK